jgi:hypothetical protein
MCRFSVVLRASILDPAHGPSRGTRNMRAHADHAIAIRPSHETATVEFDEPLPSPMTENMFPELDKSLLALR